MDKPGMQKYLGKRILYSIADGELMEGVVQEVTKHNNVKIDGRWCDGQKVFVKEEISGTLVE